MLSPEKRYEYLFTLANRLNGEFSLHGVLRQALEQCISLLGLESGWIWLTQPDAQSVYLAASHQLPPALSDHPERLSGYCWCIKKYLANNMTGASNISEISCTRLEKLTAGTNDLRYHATIPLMAGQQKLGLLNLLHTTSQRLDADQLAFLDQVSGLLATAILRTRFEAGQTPATAVPEPLGRMMNHRMGAMAQQLELTRAAVSRKDWAGAETELQQVQQHPERFSLL